MTYEVQTLIHPDTWENTWTDSLDDTPVQFSTYEDAAAELADHLRSMAYAVKNDYLEDFNPADYRIVKND
jgi:hypothetical protein